MLTHIAANLLTIWLMMHIARKLFNRSTALLAGIVWAISPPLLFLPTIFWDTSLSICLLMGLLALVLHYRQRPSSGAWILLGVYCGVAVLINLAMVFLLLTVLGWLAWQQRRAPLRNVTLGILTFAIVFSPWPIRNARVFHAFVPLRTTVGFELWMGNHEGSTGYLQEPLFPMYNAAELNDYKQRGEIGYAQNKSQLARTYIEQHPATFAALTARRIFRFWTGTGNSNGSAIFALHATLTSILGILGLWPWLAFGKQRRGLGTLFAIPLLLFPLPYYITHAEFRYRLVIDPLLTILAAYAVVTLYRRYAVRPSTESSSGQTIQ